MIETYSQYIKHQEDVFNYRKATFKKIDNFVKLYLTHIKGYEQCVGFYTSDDDKFVISYINSYNDTNNITFNIGDKHHKRLIEFIDNPELYKTTHKYNL